MKTATFYQNGIPVKTGKNREVLNYVRRLVWFIRRNCRVSAGLTLHVNEISMGVHNSPLVRIASFDIEQRNFAQLVALLNSHGSYQYSIKIEAK